jgi:putative ATP-dependent endonuclease of OLD family
MTVREYRSIEKPLQIRFPKDQPVVLVGENNAGKSNIVRALHVVLNPFWPGNYDPEDFEFFNRDKASCPSIEIRFDASDPMGLRKRYDALVWEWDSDRDENPRFEGHEVGRDWTKYINNDDRATCMCMFVEAERELKRHLGYSSKWTYLSRLMRRFHKSLDAHDEVSQRLAELFEDTKNEFRKVPEFTKFIESLQEQMADLLGSMTHRLDIDFAAYNPSNYFQSLRLQAKEGDAVRDLEELGTGEQQILALAFANAYAEAFHEGVLLVVEEPEAHLHPLAQEALARWLRTRTAAGVQTVLTTHSPFFLDMMGLEGLVLVTKGSDGGTSATQLGKKGLVKRLKALGAPDRVTEENVLPFYKSCVTREILEGFFAKMVVLVEGPSEAQALPVFFESAEPPLVCSREGVAVIPVGGKGNLAKWHRLFSAYGVPTYVVFDNDSSDDGQAAKRRDALSALGVRDEVADEVLGLGGDAWRVEECFCVFGDEFETGLRANFEDYETFEDEARAEFADGKPFLARAVALRLQTEGRETSTGSGWARVDELAAAIRARLRTR